MVDVAEPHYIDIARRRALRNEREMRTVYVSEFPAIQHRHGNGEIVTVRLKRQRGSLRVACDGCATEFVYRKPTPSNIVHFKSPLLPPVKGNWDTGDDDH